jgi:hypothetical protein
VTKRTNISIRSRYALARFPSDGTLITSQKYLEENSGILGGRNRAANVFRAVHDGDAEMFETVQNPSRECPCDAISRFF